MDNQSSRRLIDYLSRRHLLLLVLASISIKILYFAQYVDLPFLYGPVCDSIVYLRQASHVVKGQLGDPTLLAFSPLYGYFLAVAGAGYQLLAPVLLQFGLGIVNLCAMYSITKRLSDAKSAFWAASLYASYGIFLFYESKILSETIAITLGIAACGIYLLPSVSRGKPVYWILGGILVGLSVLARASLVFSMPVFACLALFSWSHADRLWSIRLKRTALLSMGMGLVLCTNGLLTWSHSDRFVPIIMVSKTVSVTSKTEASGDFIHHQQAYRDRASAFDVVQQARENLAASDINKRKADQADGSVFWGIDGRAWLKNAPGKIADTFSPRELIYQYGYLGEKSMIPILKWLPGSFALIACLALLGAVLLIRKEGWRAILKYLPFFVGCLVTTTLYHPSTRYRLAMLIPMIILAGIAMGQVLNYKPGKVRVLLVAFVVLIAIGTTSHNLSMKLSHPADWQVHLAGSAAMGGNAQAAEKHLLQAQALAPDDERIREEVERVQGELNWRREQ